MELSYFLVLPALLLASTVIDVLGQRAFNHFVDVHDIGRRLALVFAVWLAFGWFLDAEAARAFAEIATSCQGEIQNGLDTLWHMFERFLS